MGDDFSEIGKIYNLICEGEESISTPALLVNKLLSPRCIPYIRVMTHDCHVCVQAMRWTCSKQQLFISFSTMNLSYNFDLLH